MLSLPQLFRGRSVIQFQDNTQALSALIHGYALKPDMGRVVNAFHLAQFGVRARVWLEWVPSAANVRPSMPTTTTTVTNHYYYHYYQHDHRCHYR